jgi:mono/diheme cytochrome c family protein
MRLGLTMLIGGIAISFACNLTHADDSHVAAGQDIYDSYCGACHGFNGSTPLPNTPNLAAGERMDKPDSALLDAIRTGKGSIMPAWAGILSDEQCKEVLRFIRVSSKSKSLGS